MPLKLVNGVPSKFVGGWVSPEQKAKVEALAAARGTTVNGVIRELADHAVVAVVLPQKESSTGSVLADAGAASL